MNENPSSACIELPGRLLTIHILTRFIASENFMYYFSLAYICGIKTKNV